MQQAPCSTDLCTLEGWEHGRAPRAPRAPQALQTPPQNASICSHSAYLVLRLASDTVTLKAVLVPQLLAAFLAGHQHVQVADGELWEPRERRAWLVYSSASPVIITANP